MALRNWRMVNLPREFREAWIAHNGAESLPKAYEKGQLFALLGHENLGTDANPDMRWHISVRYGEPGHNGRVPTWEEMVASAHELRPGVVFVIGVPPESWWMNVHPHVLHLHETRDAVLVEEYRRNAAAMAPT